MSGQFQAQGVGVGDHRPLGHAVRGGQRQLHHGHPGGDHDHAALGFDQGVDTLAGDPPGADQVDLQHAIVTELAHILENGIHITAHGGSLDRRNGAERAVPTAPIRNLQEGALARNHISRCVRLFRHGGETILDQPLGRFAHSRQKALGKRHDLGPRARPQHGIDARNSLHNGVRITLRPTAGCDQALALCQGCGKAFQRLQ
ncbi:MAG: hypothetical protein BWY79_00321 [Actinobacteria bacterium ADurb.Bin444]|nr:MAG: hypothetical protein BWY79_00321 [Actinobacteria bacterium ADurb.Bin444]